MVDSTQAALCVVSSSLRHFPAIASFSPAINSLVECGVHSSEILVPYTDLWIAIPWYLQSGNRMLTAANENNIFISTSDKNVCMCKY